MKNLIRATISTVLLGLIIGCSSPEEKAAEYLENGNTLLEQNNLEKAALEYRNALQINQNFAQAHYSHGLTKLMLGGELAQGNVGHSDAKSAIALSPLDPFMYGFFCLVHVPMTFC